MFSLDGVQDSALGISGLAGLVPQALPDTIEKTLRIPGRNGVYDFGADLGPRVFSIPCALLDGTTEAALQAAIRALAGALVDSQGKPKSVELVFDWEPTVHYTVRYAGSLNVNSLIRFTKGKFSLPLKAADPHAYGPLTSTSNTIITSGDAGATISINNTGNVEALPKITIKNQGTGTVSGFTVSGISYAGDLVPGDSVVIDSSDYTVKKNTDNDLKNMSGEFPTLAPGDPALVYSDGGVSRNVLMTVAYRLRWL